MKNSNIATHKHQGLIKRHTRREALCINIHARGSAGLKVLEVVTLDAFRQAQADEIRTQVNQCIDLGLVDAVTDQGVLLNRVRESDNGNRITLVITAAGKRELTATPKARSTSCAIGRITSPSRPPIKGIENPLDRPPTTRQGADDHRAHPSRAGAALTNYSARP